MSIFPESPNGNFKEFVYDQFSRLGKAFASPQRLVILNILCQGEHTVEALALHAELSFANVSRHLQVLKAANLVSVRRNGKYLCYNLADRQALEFFIALRGFALNRYPEIRKVLEDVAKAPSRIDQIGMHDLFMKINDEKVYIIDVRPHEEYCESHLPGAVSMPLAAINEHLEKLPADREIVVYCRGQFCILADQALAVLREKGFTARRMNEGLIDWKLAGFPVQ